MFFLVDVLALVGDGDIFKEYKEKYCTQRRNKRSKENKKSWNYEILSSKIPIIKMDNCSILFTNKYNLYKNKLYLKKII